MNYNDERRRRLAGQFDLGIASNDSDSLVYNPNYDYAHRSLRVGRTDSNVTLQFDYLFSSEYSLIGMPPDMVRQHNFKVVNISMLNAPQCYGSALSGPFVAFGGFDVVVQNYVMNSIQKGGILVSAQGTYYTWSEEDISKARSISEWVALKISILITSLMAFFSLSCTTALLVRVLVSSGVVLIFPIFWMFGIPVINNRIISLSYPWLGIPIEIMLAANLSPIPFIVSHLVKVIVYYLMYEATQLAFSMWFYNKRYPGQSELLVYGVMMVLEYYSMIYVRSKASIQFFPRLSPCIQFLL